MKQGEIREHPVEQAIVSRKAIRAFLPDPVPRTMIDAILDVARHAPSGTNTQPWKVYVLSGAAKQALSSLIRSAFDDPAQAANYPKRVIDWPPAYLQRRRKLGKDLYRLLGIEKGDKERMQRQHARNFDFFGAPVGLIFTIDRCLDAYSYLDYGMFMQNIMLCARIHGLDTCPQGAFVQFGDLIADHLQLPRHELVISGMAVGYRDTTAAENLLQAEREPVSRFATYIDEVCLAHSSNPYSGEGQT